ncbi:MAG TPA: winged helix-turn-helix domain-containing protein [Pirellulales bacterium]
MATATERGVLQIGETAGAIWRVLSNQGPLTTAKLLKAVDVPRDLMMQALGWLAREDKIVIDESRGRVVSLRQS